MKKLFALFVVAFLLMSMSNGSDNSTVKIEKGDCYSQAITLVAQADAAGFSDEDLAW